LIDYFGRYFSSISCICSKFVDCNDELTWDLSVSVKNDVNIFKRSPFIILDLSYKRLKKK